MKQISRARIAILAALCLTAPVTASAHGSPARWSAESTDMGCWLSRWLGRTPEGGGEPMVGVQIVLGRIVPPRGNLPQGAITQPELDGETTINVRVVDPMLKEAEAVTVVRKKHNPVDLRKRPADSSMGEFPSFYLTGATADSILQSLRDGQLTEIVVRGAGDKDVTFSNTKDGVRVGVAMYDACIANKPL